MTQGKPPKLSLRQLFPSLLGMVFVTGCATVTLRLHAQDTPLTNTLVIALGVWYLLLDATVRGLGLIYVKSAGGVGGQAQVETARANLRMVAEQLRLWFLLFLGLITGYTLVALLFSKLGI